MSGPRVAVEGVSKTFRMHLRGGLELPVLRDVAFTVMPGECVVLRGPSGTGKSSILRMVYGNYAVDTGSILVRSGRGTVDIATAAPRDVLALRRSTISYVSQFLRVVPRVSTREIVAASLSGDGIEAAAALDAATDLLLRLNLSPNLLGLPPATFSGGEQQRVNIARGFISSHPLLLLDEPTASLDARNRAAVVALIKAKKASGTAILGVFHDDEVREEVADRDVDVTAFVPGREAA
ncbi:MAG: phosphonate C-P lyase system protein PhnL [Bauldia sp.]|nr:phosphonate C-P lyase system protein PhnL [Bauldia sp.]